MGFLGRCHLGEPRHAKQQPGQGGDMVHVGSGHERRKRRDREEEEKRKKMQEASRKMDALAKKLGKWDPQATIRKFRDTNLKGDS